MNEPVAIQAAMMYTRAGQDEVFISAAKGDPQAFGRLYDQYIQPVYRYLLSRLGNVAEAEDLASMTFLSAFKALPRYQHREKFSAWIFTIARNNLNDYLRKLRNNHQVELHDDVSTGFDVFQQILNDERSWQIRALITQLPESKQELLRLRFVANLTFAEMSAILGLPENTLKKQLYRTLEKLRNQLEANNE